MKVPTDSGVTLVEVLVSMAVASVALAGTAGLLAASARAVADSEFETTAIWIASRTIEQWRSEAMPAPDGRYAVDRDGNATPEPGLFEAAWTARPDAAGPALWVVTATVSSHRLRQSVTAEAVVSRTSP